MRASVSRIVVLACMFAALTSGCAPVVRSLPLESQSFVALEASEEELLGKLRAMSAAVRTISADVVYAVSTMPAQAGSEPVEQREYGPFRGVLIARLPSQIRMQADTNVPLSLITAFDMVSRDGEFRLSIPTDGKFIYGPNDAKLEDPNPMYNLRPHHVLQAMFIDIRPYLASSDFELSFEEDGPRFYTFSFDDRRDGNGQTVEKIWVDRQDLEVSRRQLFDVDGCLDMDVQYAVHQMVDGVMYPQLIVVDRPLDGTSIQIDFQPDTQFNVEIDEAVAFRLPFLSGAESIEVGGTEGPEVDDAGSVEVNCSTS